MLAIQPCSSKLVDLHDREERLLGKIKIREIRDDLVLGQFFPEPSFSRIQHLFGEYENAVNQMLFGVLDELEETIDTYGLHLCLTEEGKLDLCDVQIMNEKDISFRIKHQCSATENMDNRQTMLAPSKAKMQEA